MQRDRLPDIFVKYEPMIWNRVHRWAPANLADEAYSASLVAFMEAWDSWQPSKASFSTHLWWKIRAAITNIVDGIRGQGPIHAHRAYTDAAWEDIQGQENLSLGFWERVQDVSAPAQELIRKLLGVSGNYEEVLAMYSLSIIREVRQMLKEA